MHNMYFLIVFLPLFGFFSGIFFGRFLGKGVIFLTTFYIFISFILSLVLFYNVLDGKIFLISLGSWICVDNLFINWSFYFDTLTAVMLLVVTFISFLVHLYSTEYMEADPHLNRFMSYLSLFTFFMLILVTGNNFLQMFVGWEGVGLSSFLLINFWFTRIQANKSAIKAMLVNRVGDFFLLLAIFLLLFVFNSLDYSIIFNVAPKIVAYNYFIGFSNFFILDVICLFLFLGAMGKSAQLGLHVWLPDAMEGPTPVSALIHAATMVTAGVFLIARCSFLFELSPLVLNIIVVIGSLTAFFASTTGLFQNDIKKVIAYSTCSQLGYMFFACGLSCYEVGVFHLFNHAFFKALLFLGAGSIIHAIGNEQDLRKMGGLRKILPFSYSIMLVGSLALVGFPFLSGFYSKDVILEAAFAKYTSLSHFSYILGSLGAFFTALYSTRLLFLVFLVTPNGNRQALFNAHEGRFSLYFPLFVLSFFSLFIGFCCRDMFIGFGTDFWRGSIFELPQNYILADIEFINYFFKILPLIFTFFGIFVGILIYGYNLSFFMVIKKNKNFRKFYFFFNKKWYVDRFYAQLVTQPYLKYSYSFSYKDIDRGILENVGPYHIVNKLNETSIYLKVFQKGFIFDYLFIFFITILILIFVLLFLF